jgi:4-diphosphocytidyl-2-C-methyl-D-erythritol kinase
VVLTPPVQVPTAAVFAAPELTRNTPALKMAPFSAGAGHTTLQGLQPVASRSPLVGHNDLQPVVVQRYPEVARHLAWLQQFGDARMTGSGACVFASFGGEAAARGVLRQLPGDMQGFVAQGLDRHPLYGFCD